ncbi:NAD-dependent epimerase/dehydratase family protein [Haliangium ochraceum]|uniref:Oxidoreductase domain protein n=1 Tax=Haliangium ochraceum (strain DSM 14365 / JCM 11303 / SMP-2) TaxID=502025 RepID=D0LID4_HALO1|nr:NAD-dependent epimerase/dehydratase family protein [Haliangium ochraceum]ACY16513.1 oxidoreductase domain protein [Haliangium ochraceum DSM 14365]
MTTDGTKFKVGLVGAGGISEFHIYALRALPQCELLGIHDIDEARAQATGQRFDVPTFPSLEAMREAGANVIHVLTPPHVHAPVAIKAMELGCDVFIEKPLAEDVDEARKVLEVAERTGRVASVNHSLLYDPQVKRALELARSGALGKVVSVDILRGSDYPPYEGGPLPPHYRTAGYPFRDIGVHCYYLIQAFLGSIEHVDAEWDSLGGDPNLAFDEWRALVKCKGGIGQFQITYNTKPAQSQLIIHGTRAVLRVDLFTMFHAKRATTPLPKAAERLINAMTDSIQPLIDVPVNVVRFVSKQVQPYQGLRDHVKAFYEALEAGTPPPVSLEESIEVLHWTESVARAAEAEHAERLAQYTLSKTVPFVVTGASGSLGSAVVQRLLDDGHKVRIFVRRPPAEVPEGVEVAIGNLGDPKAVDRAIAGAETVIHVGAAMKGSAIDFECGTVVGTRNVLDACKAHGVAKLVHISSMSVVDWAGSSEGQPVSEATPLEPRADERGAYTQTKLAAEKLVVEAAQAGEVPSVVLRPGQIFGGKIPVLTGAVARRAGGRWLVLGDGELLLPLIYIDDVVDAVMAAADSELSGGEIIQLIDPEPLTQNQVLETVGGDAPVIRVPRAAVFFAGRMSEPVFGALKRQSPVAVYRLQSAMARLSFDSDRAQELLSWTPRVGVREGLRRELAQQR